MAPAAGGAAELGMSGGPPSPPLPTRPIPPRPAPAGQLSGSLGIPHPRRPFYRASLNYSWRLSAGARPVPAAIEAAAAPAATSERLPAQTRVFRETSVRGRRGETVPASALSSRPT